ncbi:hypothetical protein NMY22_g11825 [Coprinellus aureogranulatus]|nr:hypothetical protein NMY22_g11825 [Coprinellus aureogranulatus]
MTIGLLLSGLVRRSPSRCKLANGSESCAATPVSDHRASILTLYLHPFLHLRVPLRPGSAAPSLEERPVHSHPSRQRQTSGAEQAHKSFISLTPATDSGPPRPRGRFSAQDMHDGAIAFLTGTTTVTWTATRGAMHIFQNAHHFHVDQLEVVQGSFHDPLEALFELIAPGALHDSSERCAAPKCHPATRKAVQADIVSWITDGDKDAEPSQLMWLTGPAGSGKTAIAGSIADICKKDGLLAAAFFFSSFSSSANRSSKRHLVTTLAYQLAQLDGHEPLRQRILAALERDKSLFSKRLASQLEDLILRPLREVQQPVRKRVRFLLALLGRRSRPPLPISPRIIIIDGLDEVLADASREGTFENPRQANEEDQLEILSLLLQVANDPSCPFRILIASRPERVIRNFFSGTAKDITRELFLDEKYLPDADIRLFLESNFADIRRRYDLSPAWPTEDAIQGLVKAASGQFIYAATVVRFLTSATVSPQVRLEFVQTLRCDEEGVKPFASLDALYTLVLGSSPEPTKAVRWISVFNRQSQHSALFFKRLLQEYSGQADYILENLTSLIRVPSPKHPNSHYGLYHKSLIDFFEDPRRCGQAFHAAYAQADDELLKPSIQRVFKRRRSVMSLTNQQHGEFISEFMKSFNLRDYITWTVRDDPRSLDLWTMHLAILHFIASFSYHRSPFEVAPDHVLELFDYFHHKECDWREGLVVHCTANCVHWRSRILQSCKVYGWRVPGATALIRDAADSKKGAHRPRIGEWYLSPPRQRPQPTPPDPTYSANVVLGTKMIYASSWTSIFSAIRRRYSLASPWPAQGVVEGLVKAAAGRFLFAAMTVRFLSTATIAPQLRLDFNPTWLNEASNDQAAPLDALYTMILNSSPEPILAVAWISVVLSHSHSSALNMKRLLQRHSGQADHILKNLASLICIPPSEDTKTPYSLYHTSLKDFLEDPSLCGEAFHLAYRNAEGRVFMPSIHRMFKRVTVAYLKERSYRDFIFSFIRPEILREYIAWATKDNPRSPALWTMHLAVLNSVTMFPDQVDPGNLLVLYDYLHHRECQGILVHCTADCKHWRSRIFHSCKAYGWHVPGDTVAALLREACDKKGNFSMSRIGDGYFKPPKQCRALEQTLIYLPSWGPCDEHYEELLLAIKDMHSKLSLVVGPSSWDGSDAIALAYPLNRTAAVYRSVFRNVMAYLQNAHHFNLNHLSIHSHTSIHRDFGITRDPHAELYSHIAPGAIHDSYERCDAPKCHPETRKAVQEEIVGWISDGDKDAQPSKILLLTGPAGSGKTAIAGTIADICQESGVLAATFFFSSSAGPSDRSTKRCFVATLAHQYTEIEDCDLLREEILSAVKRKPTVFDKHLKTQWDTLVLKPLRDVARKEPNLLKSPRVIIVDGLDEVSATNGEHLTPDDYRKASEADQVELLSLLFCAAGDPAFPFRIIVASRPERVIREFFDGASHPYKEVFLDRKYDPDSDIRLFLQSSLTQMRRRYNLSVAWGLDHIIQQLVQNASGQFIYAATVVRFLESGSVAPHLRFNMLTTLGGVYQIGSPFKALDSLYARILYSSPQPTLAVQWIALFPRLLSFNAAFTKSFLQQYAGEANYLLENLASLVHIPPSGGDKSPFTLYHKSLGDFLHDPKRCGQELHDAYLSADEFLMERFANAWKVGLPTLAQASPECESFASEFLVLFDHDMFRYLKWATLKRKVWANASFNGNLWAMHMGVLDSVLQSSGLKASMRVSEFFDFVHRGECKLRLFNDRSDFPLRCSPACKHWRSRILHSCKTHGWVVPGPPALLRESLLQVMSRTGVVTPFHFHIFFKPDYRRLLHPSREYPPYPSLCDEQYESLLKSVRTLYSSLPGDWRSLYAAEIHDGIQPEEILSSQIDQAYDRLDQCH